MTNKYERFLNRYLDLVGLSGWTVSVTKTDEFLGENFSDNFIARAYPDVWEKEIIIHITKAFLELPVKRQLNTLFHELVHSRVGIANIEINNHKARVEEMLVNDLVRGFEKLNKNWKYD